MNKQKDPSKQNRKSGEGTKFLLLDAARDVLRKYYPHINTREKYWQWHRTNNIKWIPRFPNRVYHNWIGWNDYLSQTNTFAKSHHDKRFRPFWEAVRWAQRAARAHNIKTKAEWVQFHRDGNVPDDIPRYPDMYYSEFKGKGYRVWLGTTLTGVVMSEQQQIGLFAIMQYQANSSQPSNMIVAKVFKHGESEGKEYIQSNPSVRVIGAYKWDPEKADYINNLLSTIGTPQGDDHYLIHNLSDLTFELELELEKWK